VLFSIINLSRRIIVGETSAVKSKGDAWVADMQESESRSNKHIQGDRVGEGDEKTGDDRLAVMKKTMNNVNLEGMWVDVGRQFRLIVKVMIRNEKELFRGTKAALWFEQTV